MSESRAKNTPGLLAPPMDRSLPTCMEPGLVGATLLRITAWMFGPAELVVSFCQPCCFASQAVLLLLVSTDSFTYHRIATTSQKLAQLLDFVLHNHRGHVASSGRRVRASLNGFVSNRQATLS